MSTTQMRVHGNAVAIGNQPIWFPAVLRKDLIVWKNAYGQLFHVTNPEKIEYWFHIPIPTPTIEGKWPTLNKVWIDYDTGTWPPNTFWTSTVYISEVYIFDGNEKLKGGFDSKTIGSPKYSSEGDAVWVGNESKGPTIFTPKWAPNFKPTIKKGLGITIRVVFGKPSGKVDRNIIFHAAGAEFENP